MSNVSESDANPQSESSSNVHPGETRSNPSSGQFPKGRSGNPKGRPRGSGSRGARTSAFDVLLDKTLTVTNGDQTREVSMEEGLQQRTFRDALAGKRLAIREVLKWMMKREEWRAKHEPKPVVKDIPPFIPSIDPDNADAALVILGIAAPNPERADIRADRAQLLLEPWAAQAALNRKRGSEPLTERNRYDVQRCTRDPKSLVWPGSRK
ncbi:hypothetical protein UP09_07265 [Bradyrhizobium sp. LTSP885]|uniref:DUF5681 domain-containing protein n=1 Tax=Bradyrhizobium sp. LTSP885 TaxID=1619232 RepID=UPI0005CA3AEC|nr:DUF5681 domain-containing protein [Bradyrhizobium sp. LTSP885]KJC49488.1 hypothetical protein UP09_07265 [Bradyrhizobium sp. LTSP885]